MVFFSISDLYSLNPEFTEVQLSALVVVKQCITVDLQKEDIRSSIYCTNDSIEHKKEAFCCRVEPINNQPSALHVHATTKLTFLSTREALFLTAKYDAMLLQIFVDNKRMC